jgi:uncharacterized protein
MYKHADQGWKDQPIYMSRNTISQLIQRLNEHCERNSISDLSVVIHGGEPLLFPDLDFFFTTLKKDLSSEVFLRLAIQTNGVLVDSKKIALLNRHNVRIGISIDGPRDFHDIYRRTHGDEGSFDKVLRSIKLIQLNAPHLLESVLQVTNTKIPPKEAIDFIDSLGIPRGDFLFPDLNYDSFASSTLSPGELGKWLVEAFDIWSSKENTAYIRIFATIARLLLNGGGGTDQLGKNSLGTLMIETDGTYEAHDGLKTSFEGAGRTCMSVFTHAISDADKLPIVQAFRCKETHVSRECLDCNIFDICGGGSPIHRYKSGIGFSQPSIFCEDLKLLINHIKSVLL